MSDSSVGQSEASTLVRNLRAILAEIDNALREVGAPEKDWHDHDGPQVFSIKALAAERDRQMQRAEKAEAEVARLRHYFALHRNYLGDD